MCRYLKFLALISFSLLFHSPLKAESASKIVYLISPPRSLSVGFLRMMEARGDFKIYHEPSLLPYFRLHGYAFAEGWFREGSFESFDQVKAAILSEDSNVFVKEMSFHLRDFLDDELIKNLNVHFVFLLRNPHHTIVSLYSKIGSIVDDFHVAIGYQSAYEIYQKINANGVRKPLILFSEELSSYPEKSVRTFCDYVGIPFIENSLSWSNLGEEFSGHDEWHEGKISDLTQYWHGDAIRSTKFETLRSYEIDSLGNPTFSEIENFNDRQECEKGYWHHLPYYIFFKQCSLK